MRVTDSMITELARTSVASARERALNAQRVASSGMRVEKPSDDPAAAAHARRASSQEARVKAMLDTADASKLGLDAIDSGLSQVGDLLARARELTVQASNDTLSASDRASLATEVSSLRDAVLGVANTQVDGKYVLGGMKQDTPPFDASGAFVGDRTVPTVEVADGVRVPTSVTAGDALAPAGGVDIPAMLSTLATALSRNDVATVRSTLDALDTASTQVSTARSSVGTSQDAMQLASSLGTRMRDHLVQVRSNDVEADTVDALTALTTSQTALQQAVAIASKLPLPGLAQRS